LPTGFWQNKFTRTAALICSGVTEKQSLPGHNKKNVDERELAYNSS
jgi:hypothetical protein